MVELIVLFVVIKLGEIRLSIPDNLHDALKMRALKEKKSMKKLVIELLERGVKSA